MVSRQRSARVKRDTKELDKLTVEAKKRYGGDVMTKGSSIIPFSYIPTGVFTIDVATLGGIPDGHTSLVYGWEGSGKSTVSIKAIRQAQLKYPNLTPVYLDPETHYDEYWFKLNGVDTDNLRVIQNLGIGEAYADMLKVVALTGEVSIIVLDSIPALIPLADTEASAEDHFQIAARAKIVSKIYSNLINARQQTMREGKKPVTAILINQYREKVGGFKANPSMTPTTLPGGNSQRFLSYLSIQVKKPKITMAIDPETGFKVKLESDHGFKLEKPKAGSAFLQGEFTLVNSNLHSRCNMADIDDVAVVVKYAKAVGMIGGGGKKQTFMMFPDIVFAPKNGVKALSFMASMLYKHKEIYSLTKAIIVAMVRLRNNKDAIPYDNYLCGHKGEEILPFVEQLVEMRVVKEEGENVVTKKKKG